ncbi:uncharacterized protein LOC128955232 [Oppia nitens]|uniref:uncharacterized protein LOC128955232 n=1 Tax=Oppia nitens TaxID=1686743 RepID=UPI0023DA91AB|nr:uncharacterized protein LOC128955232 [Oppia nitens]
MSNSYHNYNYSHHNHHNDDDNNNNNNNNNNHKYWKWIIAFACSWINVFIFGLFRSMGLLYDAFIDEYRCSHMQASWPVSLIGSVASITGIAAGFLAHYYQIRTLVSAGILVSSLAISVCFLAANIVQITIFLGVIQGVGIGLVTNLLPAIISQYFGKQRAIACGISYGGSALGAFVFPLAIEWQLNEFGLSGTLLLMGGITLHALIGALLLRPPVAETIDDDEDDGGDSDTDGTIRPLVTTNRGHRIDTKDNSGNTANNNNNSSGDDTGGAVVGGIREPLIAECATVVFLRPNHLDAANHQYVNIRQLRERPKSLVVDTVDRPLPPHPTVMAAPVVKMRDTGVGGRSSHVDRDRMRAKRLSLPVFFNERRMVKDLNQSLANQLNNNRQSLAVTDSANNTLDSRQKTGQQFQQQIIIKYSLCDSIRRHAKHDLTILRHRHFQLCTVTYVCFIIDFVSFIIILPDFVTDRGLTAHEGTLLLSLYSITDFFGRLIPGWLSYMEVVTNRNLFISSIAVMGVCMLAIPFANTFSGFAAITLVCGFVTGCQMILPAVIISEYVGVDRTAMAWGLSNFICGIVTIIFRPLLIGFKDSTGKYDVIFYILGSLGIASALLWLCDYLLTKYLKPKKSTNVSRHKNFV